MGMKHRKTVFHRIGEVGFSQFTQAGQERPRVGVENVGVVGQKLDQQFLLRAAWNREPVQAVMAPKVAGGSRLHLKEWRGQGIGIEGQCALGLGPSQAVVNSGHRAPAPSGALASNLKGGAGTAQQLAAENAQMDALHNKDGRLVAALGPKDFERVEGLADAQDLVGQEDLHIPFGGSVFKGNGFVEH